MWMKLPKDDFLPPLCSAEYNTKLVQGKSAELKELFQVSCVLPQPVTLHSRPSSNTYQQVASKFLYPLAPWFTQL